MDHDEYAELLEEVGASPTLARIADLATQAGERFDPCEPAQLKALTAINAIAVMQGIDAGRITLVHPSDFLAVHRLLWAALEVIHDGRFATDAAATQPRHAGGQTV